jgi:hypothetical protein
MKFLILNNLFVNGTSAKVEVAGSVEVLSEMPGSVDRHTAIRADLSGRQARGLAMLL